MPPVAKSRMLAYHWAVLGSLLLLVASGTTLLHLCVTVPIEIPLNVGAKLSVPVFRIHPAQLGLSLRFSRNPGQLRPELGSYTQRGDWRNTGVQEFPDPGEPIKLAVRVEDKEVIYEAKPAGAFSRETIGRALVPYVNDGNPSLFPWPPTEEAQLIVPPGNSVLSISVVSVGSRIEGEVVSLWVDPPVSFFSHAPKYAWLWWFTLWPAYIVLLSIYGLILLWLSRRRDPSPEAG